ncbi:hypothetical protein DEU56DRAFT_230179 [Suillus clintonianus]|uniref:uncharacterized protein n=1 Tax=Suillus clintonianus TaxID=1904413 RepID=UPI001B862CB2|nr:uncharacterized protein DEU56DRAFT_230179 [Suillus clintonianus]KAG2156327.1 hypothetical protein DEU56DRAFT_230179 [Suillus clintonianus]
MGVLTASRIFIWMPSFEYLIHCEAALNNTATLLNFNLSLDDNVRDISVYLAHGESNEKAAIATRKGLFIVSLDPEISKLTAEAPPRPGVSVCCVTKYDHSRHRSFISCLQMTHTGLFFNWYPSSEQNRPSQPARRMAHGDDPCLSLSRQIRSVCLFSLCQLKAWKAETLFARAGAY